MNARIEELKAAFAKGLTWDEYLEGEKTFRPEFESMLEECRVEPATLEHLRGSGSLRVIAFGEGWCPDVVQHFAMIERICREMGNVTARYLRSGACGDLMDPWLENGSRTIPLIVFFDAEGAEVGLLRGRGLRAEAWMHGFKNGRKPDEIPREEGQKARKQFHRVFLASYIKDSEAALAGSIGKRALESA